MVTSIGIPMLTPQWWRSFSRALKRLRSKTLAEFLNSVAGRNHRPGRTLPTNGPLLLNHQLVRSPEKDLRWKVPTQFATEGTFSCDGLKRKLLPTGGHNSAASLASDYEGLAACAREHILGIFLPPYFRSWCSSQRHPDWQSHSTAAHVTSQGVTQDKERPKIRGSQIRPTKLAYATRRTNDSFGHKPA
jgi:hypothetical protein